MVEVWHLEQARWDLAKQREWKMPPRHSVPLALAISKTVSDPKFVPKERHRLVAGPDGFERVDVERYPHVTGLRAGFFLNQQRF